MSRRIAILTPFAFPSVRGNAVTVARIADGLSARGLLAKAERLTVDGALRARLGAAGRSLVERGYPPEREVDGYLEAYRQPIAVPAA
jgi:hypothetical protein